MNVASDFDFDIGIVGAGLVGASLAVALGSSGKKILMLESGSLSRNQKAGQDARNTVLGFGSKELLEKIGVWDALQEHLAEIDTVHVSQKGSFGVTRLSKETEGLPALGYLLPNYKILSSLYRKLDDFDNVETFENVSGLELAPQDDGVNLVFKHEGSSTNATCKLLIGADGARSQVRKQLGFKADITDYNQSAIVTNVSATCFSPGVAYERFTQSGPVALLPLANQQYSTIWVAPPEEIQTLMDLSGQEFLARLQKHFGFRVGTFESCGDRQSYPLQLLRAQRIYRNRCMLIGNAAYTVHPIAGQGFNLALRDIDYLSELLADKHDPGADVLLAQYENDRRSDVDRIIGFTDGLLRLFATKSRLLNSARGIALTTLGQVPALQRQVSRQGLGLFRSRLGLLEQRSQES